MMSKKKLLICVIAVLFLLCAAQLLFLFRGGGQVDELLAALPEPPLTRPYALLETKEGFYPEALASILTEGPYATMHKGTSRHMLLSLAPLAQDVGMLVVDEELGFAEVYAAMRFAPHEIKKLEQGVLPESWKKLFSALLNEAAPNVKKSALENAWEVWSDNMDAPLLYTVRKGVVLLAADEDPFKELMAARDGAKKSKRSHAWRDEPAWDSHAEFGTGRALSGEEGTEPVRLQVAWRYLQDTSAGNMAGEARWSLSGLKTAQKAALILGAKPLEWVVSDCIVPEPLLLSAALNIPEFKEPPEEWPFPLNAAASFARNIGLSDKQVREVLSGRTILSLGGQNRILWLSLPGALVEFTGDKNVMKELIDAFWGKFFFATNVRPIKGFEYGGWMNIPFSVVGAGKGEMAVIGLVSPETVVQGGEITKYLKDNEKAVGWIVADLPRLGDALGDMTRMSSLLTTEDGEGPGYISGSDDDDDSADDYFFSDLDQNISDSFARILRKFGKVSIVWEKPESGRMTWYK